ncbi:MAG: pyridoxamine 5'-phosphate oxidase [Pseudomonadota bacterium]
MEQRQGIFEGDDPVAIARRWMAEAEATEVNDPNAMQLATVDAQGRPNVRTVLLKEIEQDAFVFYTNYDSVKGEELQSSGYAAFVLHWKTLGRQVRVRGQVTREDGPQADAYYASRALGSRIGAHASLQSQPLDGRATLEERVKNLTDSLGDAPPRPANWGGFRITPFEVELWANGEFRLHDRFRWTRTSGEAPWDAVRLYP